MFLHENIRCGYSLESPRRGDSNEYPQRTFLWSTVENYSLIIIRYPLYPFHYKIHLNLWQLILIVKDFDTMMINACG